MGGHRSRGRWPLMCGMLMLFSVAVAACGDDPQQVYETAQFEEQQRNFTHARELYEQLVRDHPDSTYAERARKRLAELGREDDSER